MAIEVRILKEGEAGALDRVAPEVFDEEVSREWCEQFLADPRHHIAVALEQDTVVGMASAVDYIHPDKPVELWINEVGVSPGFQRQGIGTQLLRALLGLGRELGCEEAWVATERDNEPARALYASEQGRGEPVVMYSFSLTEDLNS